jgi:membrane-bound metal-dependent hydrolase YbcI (DUF457 family)
MSILRLLHPGSLITCGLSLFATVLAHRKWKLAPKGTVRRGLLDIFCHFGTACAVILPMLRNTSHQRLFGATAIVSAVALDLDHILAARSLQMRSWMTMPSRPPTHSLPAMVAIAWLVERVAPGRRLWLAVTLGVGSHLLRDLATGGAPFWHPRRVITWPVPTVMFLLCLLPVAGWYLAGLPVRSVRGSGDQPES